MVLPHYKLRRPVSVPKCQFSTARQVWLSLSWSLLIAILSQNCSHIKFLIHRTLGLISVHGSKLDQNSPWLRERSLRAKTVLFYLQCLQTKPHWQNFCTVLHIYFFTMYKKIRNFWEFFALAIIGSETFKRAPSVSLYSILYGAGTCCWS